ncbi:unnamed protein product [Cladocopium goreaui]|uniref:Uncharacterized protein n=1 Tax=Cladocopium goreaui TaxID=2562237 RepID=A0A9P1BUW7_9DINO|nr:unnamed protein product [Cladocopium goreaui]
MSAFDGMLQEAWLAYHFQAVGPAPIQPVEEKREAHSLPLSEGLLVLARGVAPERGRPEEVGAQPQQDSKEDPPSDARGVRSSRRKKAASAMVLSILSAPGQFEEWRKGCCKLVS